MLDSLESFLKKPPKKYSPSKEDIKSVESRELQESLLKRLSELDELNNLPGRILHDLAPKVGYAALIPIVSAFIDFSLTRQFTSNTIHSLNATLVTSGLYEGFVSISAAAAKGYSTLQNRIFAQRVWKALNRDRKLLIKPMSKALPKPS